MLVVDIAASEAVQALLDRGINAPQTLMGCGTPEQILATCHRYDRQQHVTPGLLVHWIRTGNFEDPAPAEARSRPARTGSSFVEYARRYPVGSKVEPHAILQQRCGHDDEPCAGSMIVIDLASQQVTARCDECGYEAAYSTRVLRGLVELAEMEMDF